MYRAALVVVPPHLHHKGQNRSHARHCWSSVRGERPEPLQDAHWTRLWPNPEGVSSATSLFPEPEHLTHVKPRGVRGFGTVAIIAPISGPNGLVLRPEGKQLVIGRKIERLRVGVGPPGNEFAVRD